MRSRYRLITHFTVGLLLLLTGCATLQNQTDIRTIRIEPTANTRHTQAQDFSMAGRVSIQNAHQRYAGSMRWQHTEFNDNILLLSPLGQAIAEISQDQQGANLTTSKNEVFYADDMESLTQEVLGWHLPITGLQYWIQGDHSPLTAAEKDINSHEQLVAIRQDGWQIRYLRFFPTHLEQPEQIIRPKVLELSYQDLKIKLVIDNWQAENNSNN